MKTTVTTNVGYYTVTTHRSGKTDSEQVDKGKHCTCGGTADKPCTHIRAVAAYLQLGGEVAPQADLTKLPSSCPICGSPVIAQADRWRCIESAGHYWQWRGEQSGVKDFLTKPHPAKQGAFYEQSLEEHARFIETAHRRMHANGYTPYGA
jgi:hypothetical protein